MGIYKYRLKADYVYESGTPPTFGAWQTPELHFADDWGKYWLSIHVSGRITVRRDYSWDGCSPKFRVFGKLLGTPEGEIDPLTGYPATYHASLIHDALYQFMDHPRMPYTKAQADLIFYRILQSDRFGSAHLYYAAVKWLGGAYRWINQWRVF